MHSAVVGKPLSAIYICIDEYGAGRMEGRLYSPCLFEPLTFNDANHFFIYLEQLMEYPCYPQAFQRKRAFGEPSELETPLFLEAQNLHEDKIGKVATGEVHVISRQNTSWQGFVIWKNSGTRATFNSDLELLSRIHEYCTVSA